VSTSTILAALDKNRNNRSPKTKRDSENTRGWPTEAEN